MPALLTARYDERDVSLVLWYQRLLAAYDQISTEQNTKQLNPLREQVKYLNDKMMETLTLHILEEIDTEESCQHDRRCIQEEIDSYTANYTQLCQQPKELRLQAICFLR